MVAALDLRPFQRDALANLDLEFIFGSRRVVLVAPTGSGKTVMACDLIRRSVAKWRHVLFVASARQLVLQCSRKLDSYGINHGVIMRGVDPYHGASVQVASLQTLASRAIKDDKLSLPRAELLIFDECHKSLSPTHRKLMEKYPKAQVLGLTATPVRSDGRGLGDVYGGMVHAAKPSELIQDGYMVACRVFAPSEPDMTGVESHGGDWSGKHMAERVEQTTLTGDIYSHWQEYGEDRPTFVFAPSLKQSREIAKEFARRGIPAMHLEGDTEQEDRDYAFKAIEGGDLRIISSCGVLREGIDVPCVSCGILLQPTKHLGTYVQMPGRLLRPYPGKRDAILLDHSGAVHRHGFPDQDFPWELVTTENKVREVQQSLRKDATTSEPICCPKCAYVRKKGRECPRCGHVHARSSRKVITTDGRLVELERRVKKPKCDKTEKQKYWDECVGWCIGTDRKMGAAAGRYKQKFGVWPRGLNNMPSHDEWRMRGREFYRECVR